MKNAANEPEHLRDALASLPEPVALQDLAMPQNLRRQQDAFFKTSPEEPLPANHPASHPRPL